MNLKNSNRVHYKKALDYSLRLLAHKDRSETDIRNRLLQKGYDEETINEVIKRLNSLGYIDEENLVNRLISVAINEKNYGRYSLKPFLVSKGINEKLLSVLNIPDEAYIKSAKKFIDKKKRLFDSLGDEECKNRLIQMLLRRGHDIETIKMALNIKEEING